MQVDGSIKSEGYVVAYVVSDEKAPDELLIRMTPKRIQAIKDGVIKIFPKSISVEFFDAIS